MGTTESANWMIVVATAEKKVVLPMVDWMDKMKVESLQLVHCSWKAQAVGLWGSGSATGLLDGTILVKTVGFTVGDTVKSVVGPLSGTTVGPLDGTILAEIIVGFRDGGKTFGEILVAAVGESVRSATGPLNGILSYGVTGWNYARRRHCQISSGAAKWYRTRRGPRDGGKTFGEIVVLGKIVGDRVGRVVGSAVGPLDGTIVGIAVGEIISSHERSSAELLGHQMAQHY
eukprot:gene26067-34073_t